MQLVTCRYRGSKVRDVALGDNTVSRLKECARETLERQGYMSVDRRGRLYKGASSWAVIQKEVRIGYGRKARHPRGGVFVIEYFFD